MKDLPLEKIKRIQQIMDVAALLDDVPTDDRYVWEDGRLFHLKDGTMTEVHDDEEPNA